MSELEVPIRWRHGTAANATANNPTLGEGEAGYETDTGKFKIGDGSTAWNDLPYAAATPEEVDNATSVATGVPASVSYDAQGWVEHASTPGRVIDQIQRDSDGLVESFDLNDVTYTVTRDGDGRITEVST